MPELDQQWTAPQGSVRTQDGPDPPGCGLLDRRWVLWEEFMKEHAHLDAWLRLAEQDVCSLPISPSQVTYDKAKEELRKLERWRSQASSRLILLDRLTLRTRTLTRLFDGAVRAQLLTWAQECGRRWDEVSAKLESVSGGLKLFVSEWEEFEAEREELALWLADMDVRLTEVDRLMGNTCQKLRRLQCLQQCVCVNLDRVNSLLLRGEALICGSRTTDAEQVERRLVDLLQKCTHMCNNMTRTHTRLLSRKLVFEDTCLQSHASDSGCPSESLLDDEGALDKLHLDLPASPNHCTCVDLEPKGFEAPSACSGGQGGFVCTHLPSFTDPPPPSHEHLGLEWDPSVDIGRSVSCDDADAEVYVISCTGLCCTDGAKRPNYLSDISDDITNQDGDSVCNDLFMFIGQKLPEQLKSEDQLNQAYNCTVTRGGGARPSWDQWVTPTTVRPVSQPSSFDGGWVRAWLGVQSPAPPPQSPTPPPQSQTKGVQTDWEGEDEGLVCGQSVPPPSSPLAPPALLCILLAAAVVLLVFLVWTPPDPPCHHWGRTPLSFHLTLTYVNGAPPT
ncbi:nesprin-2 isoform X2 [Sphaeramia orbicularis]|uniref:nesprin-2 isoform X2 n=1 Tax=Sphaeramia orbicularis TaxID=375764 RepID=UPI00117FFFE3|nr:nesprin-2-like isoform X2 [Sphaeramia orbicularis]